MRSSPDDNIIAHSGIGGTTEKREGKHGLEEDIFPLISENGDYQSGNLGFTPLTVSVQNGTKCNAKTIAGHKILP
jgi:hypothetical protein